MNRNKVLIVAVQSPRGPYIEVYSMDAVDVCIVQQPQADSDEGHEQAAQLVRTLDMPRVYREIYDFTKPVASDVIAPPTAREYVQRHRERELYKTLDKLKVSE